MDALIRFAHSASLPYMPPTCQRPTFPLSRMPFSIPSLPRCKLPSAASSSPPSFFGGKGKRFLESEVGRERMMKWEEKRKGEKAKRREIILHSIAPHTLLFFAALPGTETVRSVFGPFVELVKTWNLPGWLVHWGHPGNMAVVLFAMGGYGSYLGFRIRLSKNAEEKAMAKNLHPKLLIGMFFFFALGSTGGITALLTSDKPILESPHAVSGLMGLSLLTIQTILPALFEG
ncbi:uncharacterized protein LOC110106352 isoform X2 [Dendrobium catenatum]|uniref:uncharacterized protein LOC110106352 isoform X2 n=1 Tax=Dendrobium catenatum TaxID=906689 RepID=UPI0010A0C3A9|nr:uncharacterized protein LOC110106352 isoform X2 [Dendrobium catenatum]